MADDAADAWARLLATLAQAGTVVSGPLGGRTDRELAEGYRHLTRVLSIATEMLVEKGDRARPAFTRWMSPYRKMLGDNPGTIYDAAMIDPALTYRLSGLRGSAAYLGICVYGTAADGARRIVGNLDDVDLPLGEDGSFEVWLGSYPPGAVGIALDADATDVMVRQYFVDPAMETPATYDIEAAPSVGAPPPLTQAEIAVRLDAVGAYVRDIVEAETTLSALVAAVTPAVLRAGAEFVDAGGVPTDPPIDPAVVARVMPSPAIQYAGSWFDDLGDDEVLLVEGTVPTCRYWSIQLLSRFMESGDYRYEAVYLSGADIAHVAGERFVVGVAHRDPGLDHWITTTGLTSANIAVRALLAEGTLDVTFRRERLPLP